MLDVLIPYIDTRLSSLGYFAHINGLAEKFQESGEDPRQYPAVFNGSGNYAQVIIEPTGCYHRMHEKREFREIEENDWGCSHAYDITYPNVLVGVLNRSQFDCQVYSDDAIVNSIAYKLIQTHFGKEIRAQAKVFSVEVELKSVNTDRWVVWKEEYDHIDMGVTYDKIYFSIRYDLRIKADSSCLNIIEC